MLLGCDFISKYQLSLNIEDGQWMIDYPIPETNEDIQLIQVDHTFGSVLDSQRLEVLDQQPDQYWFMGTPGKKEAYVPDVLDIEFNVVEEQPFDPLSDDIKREEQELTKDQLRYLNSIGYTLAIDERELFVEIWQFIQASQKVKIVDILETVNFTFDMNQVCGVEWETFPSWQKRCILHLLKSYEDRWATTIHDLERTTWAEFEFECEQAPRPQKPFRLSPVEDFILQEQVNEYMKAGMLVKSRSTSASAAFLVRRPKEGHEHLKYRTETVLLKKTNPTVEEYAVALKKYFTFRLCGNYTKLNEVTKKVTTALPVIQDLLDWLSGMVWFSKCDFKSCYMQIGCAKRCQELTAIITRHGVYEWTVTPFGPTNAVACAQRLLERLVADLPRSQGIIDDVLTVGQTFFQHLRDIKSFFQRCREAKMKMHPGKLEIFKKELLFMGFTVGQEGLKVHKAKVVKLQKFERPQTKRDVKSLQGFLQFVRMFIPNLAKKLVPMTKLLKKHTKFVWGREQEEAYQDLKKALNSKQCLRHPDFSKKFILFVDASNYAIGGVLTQEYEGRIHFVRFASKTLNGAQSRYSATERECLAVVYFIEYFRFYLFGNYFEVVSDHGALRYLMDKKSLNARLSNWATRLSPYYFGIKYIKGTLNPADAPSRMELDDGQVLLGGLGSRSSTLHTTDSPIKNGSIRSMRPCEVKIPILESDIVGKDGTNHLVPKLDKLACTNVSTDDTTRKQSTDYSEYKNTNLGLQFLGKGYIVEDNYKEIITFLKEGKVPEMLSNNMKRKFRRAANLHELSGNHLYIEKRGLKLFVPEPQERLAICQAIHAAGHPRIRTMYIILAKKYYWKGMSQTIQHVLDACETCNRDRRIAKRMDHRHSEFIENRPFKEIEIDHVSIPDGWSRYLLVITDTYSGFTFCFSVFSKALEYVALILILHVFPLIGIPEIIRSDGGFAGAIMEKINEYYQIKQKIGNPYHPQSQAQVERTGGEIVSKLARVIRENNQLPWEAIYPQICLQHNTIPLDRLKGRSRFEVAFGYKTRNIHDANQSVIGGIINLRYLEDFLKYRQKLKEYLSEALAKGNIDALSKISTGHITNQLKRGDLVYADRYPGKWKGRKLMGNLYGPYIVVKVFEKGSVKIMLDDGRAEMIAAQHLRKRPTQETVSEEDIRLLETPQRRSIAEKNQKIMKRRKVGEKPRVELPPQMEDIAEQKRLATRQKMVELAEELQESEPEVLPRTRRSSRPPRGYYNEMDFPEEWFDGAFTQGFIHPRE